MGSPFAAGIAAQRALSPMQVESVAGRLLLLDGDGLAYYCAGNNEATQADAKSRLTEFVSSAMRSSGAEELLILLTASGSHKGHRYAIARRKPYQGQRHSPKPKNWAYLRSVLEAATWPIDVTATAEADDLFGKWVSVRGPQHVVIGTQDKDMRMLPGWHMNWQTKALFWVERDTFDATMWDKQFGEKWFWLQMLHGDTVDNIPGLPLCTLDGKKQQCGEARAQRILRGITTNDGAWHVVRYQYEQHYGIDWAVEMLEQACLLWMRTSPESDYLDCTLPWNPMANMTNHPDAIERIVHRVKEALHYQAQANGSTSGQTPEAG